MNCGFRNCCIRFSSNPQSAIRNSKERFKFRLDSPAQKRFRSDVLRKFAICFALATLALGGCCCFCKTWPWAPPVSPDRIVIYTSPPPQNYFNLGTVSVPGGRNTIPACNYHQLQLQAACLGANAVILTDQIPADDPDFWLYPHTGVAIQYATSSLHPLSSVRASKSLALRSAEVR
jgi:hypothetical protein